MLQIPSLRAVFKYLPNPEITSLALIALSALAYAMLLGRSRAADFVAKILSRRLVTVLLLGAVIVATYWIYPQADARKHQGLGSTADDALIVPLKTLLAGRPLYSGELMGGVAASPGPGWILVNAPFTLGHGYFLLTAFYVSLLWNAIHRRRRSLSSPNLMLVLLLSSLAFWELTVTGHDVIATSCAIGALMLWTERASERGSLALTLWLAVAWGTLATARIIYPFLIPLAGMLLWKRDRRLATAFTLAGSGAVALWHLPFWMTNHPYDPFHLLGRAEDSMGTAWLAVGAIATAIAGVAAFTRVTTTRQSLYGWFLICFTTPLLFVAAGELFAVGGAPAFWEGANYLLPPVGTLLAYLCTHVAAEPPQHAGDAGSAA